MGKTRIIAETGAGQHGVATATVCATLGPALRRLHGRRPTSSGQAPNVLRMKMLGAEVAPGDRRRRHAQGRHERGAARLGHQCRRHLLPASAPPPARTPIRTMVRDFQSVIGDEITRADAGAEGQAARRAWSPASAAAPTPSAPSTPSSTSRRSRCYGAEAGGHGIDVENGHAASMTGGTPGVLHGNRTYLLQDADGQILEDALDLGRPRLSRRRAGALLPARQQARRPTSPITDNEALDGVPALHPRSRASSRRWRSAHGLAQRDEAGADHAARTRPSCCASRAAATRTSNGRPLPRDAQLMTTRIPAQLRARAPTAEPSGAFVDLHHGR